MYIDGYVMPVTTARQDEYLEKARAVARVFLKHGATRVTEGWAEDVPYGERTSFPRAVQLAEGETAVFAWIEFPDKPTRDACYKAAFADPDMPDMRDKSLIDGARMIFGGFVPLIDERSET